MQPTAPDRGDVVWITMNPSSGHAQAGRRPALVLSPVEYNRLVGLALMCPVTSKAKGYPFEVTIPEGLPVVGVVLTDQIRSLDWRARGAEVACRLPDDAVTEALNRLATLIGRDTSSVMRVRRSHP